MATIQITKEAHREIKRLAIDTDESIAKTGSDAVLCGIEEMRRRLENRLRDAKARKKT